MTYTCWQCSKDFERQKDEWRCPECRENPEPIDAAKPRFNGRGFYSTEGR